jgi:hydroxypyruvate reductase
VVDEPVRAARRDLLSLYHTALTAVDGRRRVAGFLRRRQVADRVHAVAIGKAAVAMVAGADDALGPSLGDALVVTEPNGCQDLPVIAGTLRCLEGAHPVPDERSLAAGEVLVDFLQGLPRDAALLFLTSGGASSLVERPAPGVSLDALREANRWLLASGLPIHSMNRVRKALSAIKGGRLAALLAGRPVLHLVLSDVPGDDLASIGSGLLVPHAPERLVARGIALPAWLAELVAGSPPPAPEDAFRAVEHAIVASAAEARAAAAHSARKLGYPVHRHDALAVGDARQVGVHLAGWLREGPPGVQVWSGETTVRLPARPGRGGRCQTLALAAATALAGSPELLLLAAGTDGRDGSSEDAGALVDAATLDRGALAGLSASDCLDRADAGAFLAASGDLIHTGPTGTNVMDLMIGLRIR